MTTGFQYAGNKPRPGRGLLIVSVICLFGNFLIGETILANVILIYVSFLTALSAFFKALIAWWKADKLSRSTGVIIGAAIVIAIIIGLAATDSIPAGYGP